MASASQHYFQYQDDNAILQVQETLTLPPAYITIGAPGFNGFIIHGINNGDYTGTSVHVSDAVNGDGAPDILIGAGSANNYYGQTYVVFGGNSNLTQFDAADGSTNDNIHLSGLNSHGGHRAGMVLFSLPHTRRLASCL